MLCGLKQQHVWRKVVLTKLEKVCGLKSDGEN